MFESVSVDGYFADAAGGIGWAHAAAPDPEYAGWVAGNAGSNRDLLFGRRTYEMMAAFWPTPMAAQQMPAVAAGMNAATKHVVSKTIRPEWVNSRLLEGELVPGVRALKASPGPDIVVLGSGEVAAQLGAAGLVDEYQLVIVPIVLGAGRTIFTTGRPLGLVSHRAFPGGNVVVTYAT